MNAILVPNSMNGLQIMEEVRENLVETDWDYAFKTGMCSDDEEYESLCDNLVTSGELHHIQKILSVQLAIFVLRRLNGMGGYHIDALCDISSELKAEYQEKFEKEYNDLNKGVDY